MSPKHVLVLLLALVFAATSFANNPKPPHKDKPPTEQELSIEEQDNWQFNSNRYKPPFHNHKPPHKPPTTLQNELSVPITEHKPPVDNTPKKKPPHGPGHHPENTVPKKPPHRPPHDSPVEENVEEDKYKPPYQKPPYKPPHKPPTAN